MNFIKKHFISIFIFLSALRIVTFAVLTVREDISLHQGNVVINEVCSSNLSSVLDGDLYHPDWAELYNSSDSSIDISGWKLSDSPQKRNKWSFPEGTLIPSHGFLLVYLDDGDSGLHASFRLKRKGEGLYLSSRKLLPMDQTEVPELKYDTVWGRETDGKGSFIRMTPTPGESNSNGSPVSFPVLPKPVLSHQSGFYKDGFNLSISSTEGEIRYTLDGSDPDFSSPLYSGPISIADRSTEDNNFASRQDISVDLLDYIHALSFEIPDEPVDKCTVVRAAVFKGKDKVSDTATASYFIGFDEKKEYDEIGVISLVSDTPGLFGFDNGILVIGRSGVEDFNKALSESANAVSYLKEHPETPTDGTVKILDTGMSEFTESNYMQSGPAWEREALLTVFDKDHYISSEDHLGIRVRGHRTRNFPKKTLNLFARKIYGNDSFDPDLFIPGLNRLSLFAGGQDNNTLLRDILISDLTKDLSFASPDFSEPYYIFINGEFWGLYRICDRFDENFISLRFNVDPDDVVIIKNSVLSAGTEKDFDDFWSFKTFIEEADLSSSSDYDRFCSMADIDSFIDYFAARMFFDEGLDWPNINTSYWKTRNSLESSLYSDGKWRCLNFDNNLNIHYDSVSDNTMAILLNGNKNHKRSEVFYKLMQNEGFRQKFYDAFLVLATEVFDPEKTVPVLESYASEIRPYISADYDRFYGDNKDLSDFDREVEEMKCFLRERAGYMIPYVREACFP